MRTDEDIIARVVWKLDKTPSEVIPVYEAYIQSIIQQLRNNESVIIPTLGSLEMRNGNVEFSPASEQNTTK